MTRQLKSPVLENALKEKATRQTEAQEARDNIHRALDEAAQVAKDLESVQIPAARRAIRDGRGSWLGLAKLIQRQELARDFRLQKEPLLRGIGGLETPDLDIKIQTLRADLDKYLSAKKLAVKGVGVPGNLKTMGSLAAPLGLQEDYQRFKIEIATESAA